MHGRFTLWCVCVGVHPPSMHGRLTLWCVCVGVHPPSMHGRLTLWVCGGVCRCVPLPTTSQQMKDVERSLLIISQDYNSDELDQLLDSVDFCLMMRCSPDLVAWGLRCYGAPQCTHVWPWCARKLYMLWICLRTHAICVMDMSAHACFPTIHHSSTHSHVHGQIEAHAH